MINLKEYSQEQLDAMRFGRLGCLYMSTFTLSKKDPSLALQLEEITRALFRRNDVKSKMHLQAHMQMQLRSDVKSENYEQATVMRDMLRHYQQRVLG